MSATGSAVQMSGAVRNARAKIKDGLYGQLTPEQMNEVDKYFILNNGRLPDATLIQNAIALAKLMAQPDAGQPSMAQAAPSEWWLAAPALAPKPLETAKRGLTK
jgi:hypothetical protein